MDSPQPGATASSSSASPSGVSGVPSPQFAILNYFFPGFSVFSSAANAYFETDINTFLPLLLAVLGGVVVWTQARDSLWSLVDDYLMSSVCIRTDDEVYNMVMLWLSKQGFSRNSRHFLANTDITSRNRYMYRYADSDDEDADDDEDDDDDGGGKGAASRRRKALHYTPAFGSHFFWYKGHPLFFERHKNREQVNLQTTSEREELSLWCFGRNPRILKELLLDARQMHMSKDERKTLIYRGNLNETYWQRCMSRLNRPFSTVILNERVKKELLEDAADYLDPATRRWYANRGIPYRRGYLLHGPPGTGKSSLSLALAGYFRMKIYIVSLSSAAATEENITTLFHELPTRCIVLLEDIDSAGLTHTRDDASVSGSSPTASASSSSSPESAPPPAPPAAAQSRLSLSGLLNILDGVASQEGRILIMTTNHIEKLDKALIRPGRVDMIVPFSLADAEMTSAIFRAIYAPYDNETVSCRRRPAPSAKGGGGIGTGSSSTVSDDSEAEEERAAIRERVEDQAKRFAAKMPEGEFSPAEVQGLLLRHKRSPDGAIAAAEEWVARMRRNKKEQAEQKQTKEAQQEQPKPEKSDSGESDSGTSESEREEVKDKHEVGGEEDSKKSTNSEGIKSEAEIKVKVSEAAKPSPANAKGPLARARLKSASDSGYDTP
ncbi:ATPase family associated with various cellular activities (AAA) domain-containing protein [Hirsutella rhossiliensis]|uniref:ATPase family associated with various cellular activities (AAA) domain-containing protein n=1 Tax=Hirsutella rhossiliensis TaxID=111463 RepID=A0A9P8SDI2_9HYPO|nr:ATPase family associated with various cellular activities (AAA) domain-containing protein [Hirsutella rhossiliensis]KAH0958621.1 ATPase family associated with various cellular activities (AAA) domain-containing protein [Hirsutella rhossiliensis]